MVCMKLSFFCFFCSGNSTGAQQITTWGHVSKPQLKALGRDELSCYTTRCTQQPREQPQIGDRGSVAMAVNKCLFFLLGPHVLTLFFYLLIFIILRGLLHLI